MNKMALPIIVFELLLVIALALFLFGASRQSLNAGFGFLLLSSIILLVSGLFVWGDGLQLEQPQTIDASTSVISISYQVVTATYGSALWVISNVLVYGGIGLVLLAFVLTVKQRREASYEQQLNNS